MPLTSRAKKHRVVIQCVARTSAECLGTSFVTAALETWLETESSGGTCAGTYVATLTSVFPELLHLVLRHIAPRPVSNGDSRSTITLGLIGRTTNSKLRAFV